MKLQLILLLVAATAFGITLTQSTSEPVKDEVTIASIHNSIEWKNMDREQRIDYMRSVVLPKMRQLFAEFDSKEFPRINCKTCHGDGVTNETYEMPNPKLPKLPSSTEGFMALMKKDSAAMTFMMHKVKPVMAELLGMTPSEPTKGIEGFGCGNCHTFKK